MTPDELETWLIARPEDTRAQKAAATLFSATFAGAIDVTCRDTGAEERGRFPVLRPTGTPVFPASRRGIALRSNRSPGWDHGYSLAFGGPPGAGLMDLASDKIVENARAAKDVVSFKATGKDGP